MKLIVNDFFCGAGGMGLGFDQAGYILGGAWDFDKFAVKTYKHNISDKVFQIDIREMVWSNVPYAHVWTFGFPCQDISIAKDNGKGLEGDKSKMFFEIMRLLDETREHNPKSLPKIILAENVANLKKHLGVIEKEYAKRGYKFYAKLMDSQKWGLAQRRKRYFLVGVLNEIKDEFVFPEEPKLDKLVFDDILEVNVADKYYIDKPYVLCTERTGSVIGALLIKGRQSIKRIYNRRKVAPTLTTSQGGQRQPKIIDHKGLRKATPREYARLQGFEDNFEQVVSDSQFYKQMGNAVSVPVSKAMANAIKTFLMPKKGEV